MWRSSLTLAARPIRHVRQFKIRRNQGEMPARAAGRATFKPNVARNLAFAAGSSCLFFTGGAIYMYEGGFSAAEQDGGDEVTQQVPKQNKRARRNRSISLWNRLPSYDRTFIVICGVNALVYAMWKFPRLSPFMTKFFARSPMSSRVTPMLLSVFSHNSFLYLSLNMLTLKIFIGPATSIIGDEQFLVTYLTAGVCSSVASHFIKCYLKIPTISMGAGGAVLCMWTLISLADPNGRIYLSTFFLPPLSCSIRQSLQALVLVDIIGIIRKAAVFDHTARLAGVLVSIAYFKLGHKFHQWYTDRVVDVWDRFRRGDEDP